MEDDNNEKVVTTDQYSDLKRQLICEIGRIIVLAGAIFKSGRELNEISRMGIQGYFRTTVNDYF
jgi:hypothetical protein